MFNAVHLCVPSIEPRSYRVTTPAYLPHALHTGAALSLKGVILLPPAQAQELSLNYHCKCEQWVHFGTGSFFNFNGTAGVWRRKCIESIGGWNSRTTVCCQSLAVYISIYNTCVHPVRECVVPLHPVMCGEGHFGGK